MGFDIRNLSLLQRSSQSAPHDEKIRAACSKCSHRDLCGGFWVWDDSRWCDEDCQHCPAMCCHRPAWFSDAVRLNGLQFDDVHWTPWKIDWPELVWMIGGRCGGLHEPVYVIPVDSLMDRFSLNWARTPNLRERFSIPESSKVGISFCFQDWLLNHFRDREDLVADALERFDVDFVMPINYSAYRNFPRLDQLLAMRRRMLSMKLFQEHGIQVVPDIGAVREIDADRYGDWVLREGCDTVFTTVQTMRGNMTKTEYRVKLGTLLRFRERVGPDVRILMQGASARRMPFFKSHLGKISFINHAAWVKAELRIDAVSNKSVRDQGLSVQDTFTLNVRRLKAILYKTQTSAVSSIGGPVHGQ